jgi:hypothetical protein
MRLPIDPHRALVDEAGKLYVLQKELGALRKQRDEIDTTIRRLERQIVDAKAAVAAKLERASSRRGAHVEVKIENALMPGKLPHRVLAHMQREPTRIYLASEIRESLAIPDVQQIRTALARLVDKGLVQRLEGRGEFTLPQRFTPPNGQAISSDDGLQNPQQIGDGRVADEA